MKMFLFLLALVLTHLPVAAMLFIPNSVTRWGLLLIGCQVVGGIMIGRMIYLGARGR